eukprot:CAMPEP_0184666052 /NCGR_PEP_ID=MMETSP0308-20130426/59860_1 /TAXON_ID=38269 /ORGANISM="Gloeochaete witrockiana, Strain SAG 46.84" /LENGTH=948 /DNA_ID=CAMNT_0027110431 /DNA_START=288 /DNA_END=3134 /DNA_ORIENTATION=+
MSTQLVSPFDHLEKPFRPQSYITVFTTVRDMNVEDLQLPPDNSLRLAATKQMNALRSWTSVLSRQSVLVLADSRPTCKFITSELPGIRCFVHACTHPEFQLPKLDCIFISASERIQTDVVAYINADLLIFDDFPAIMERVFIRGRQEALVVAQRTDIAWTNATEFQFHTLSERQRLRSWVQANGELHSDYGADFFVFRKSLFSLLRFPPLLVGTWRWDNWLLAECIVRKDMRVIDASNVLNVVHQGTSDVSSHRRLGSSYSDELVKKLIGSRYRIGRISFAPWYLEASPLGEISIVRNLSMPVEVMVHRHAARIGDSYVLAVMTVNSGYAQLALNWLCWVRRTGFENFILLAEDKWTAEFFRSRGLYNVVVSPDASEKKTAAEYGSIEFQVTMTYRTSFLGRVLNAGVDFLTGDLDSVWLNNPLVELDPNCDLQGQPHKENKISGGLVAVKATKVGRFFWHKVVQCQLNNMQTIQNFLDTKAKFNPSKYTEQECINDLAIEQKGLRFCRLDTLKYPDGRAFFEQHVPQKAAVWPTIIHNNWIIGVDAKTDRFKRWGMWAVSEDLQCVNDPSDSSTTEFTSDLLSSLAASRSFKLHIRIVTGRGGQGSVKDLIQSLVEADISLSSGDSIDISVLAKGTESVPGIIDWPHGSYEVVKDIAEDDWMYDWNPNGGSSSSEALLVLEDSCALSKYFYRWARDAYDFYHFNRSNADPRLFGIGLHDPMEAVMDTVFDSNPSNFQRLRSHLRPATAFRFQGNAPWGTIFFPSHWKLFLAWLTQHLPASPPPCVPGRLTNRLWCSYFGPDSTTTSTSPSSPSSTPAWYNWHDRFVFDKGMYALYPYLPDHPGEAIIVKKANSEDQGGVLAHEPITFPPPTDPSWFLHPNLLQMMDYQFKLVTVDASILSHRHTMFTLVPPEELCSWQEDVGVFRTCPTSSSSSSKKDKGLKGVHSL